MKKSEILMILLSLPFQFSISYVVEPQEIKS